MLKYKHILLLQVLFLQFASWAELIVSVAPPIAVGDRTLVKLEMVNGFFETVKSARATCFLLNHEGKMVGQTSQWVIGGSNEKRSIKPGETNFFNIVIGIPNQSSTNLAAKVIFTHLNLENGVKRDPLADVVISTNIPSKPVKTP